VVAGDAPDRARDQGRGSSQIGERLPIGRSWRDGDLVWLGLLLSVVSAALMIALVWWLFT